MRSLGLVLSGSSDYDQSAKQQLKEFTRISNEIMALDISEVAEEITRVQAKYFLDITVSLFFWRSSVHSHCVCRIETG